MEWVNDALVESLIEIVLVIVVEFFSVNLDNLSEKSFNGNLAFLIDLTEKYDIDCDD